MTDVFTGRCLCGAVRYECGPPVSPPCFCHCASCRRASGSHAVAWATVARESFRVIAGELRSFSSSPQVQRESCSRCGTPLTYWHESYSKQDSAPIIDITVATLDNPNAMPPVDHIWMEDATEWDRPQDGRPRFARSRQEPK